MVVSVLADRLGTALKSHRTHASVAEARVYPGGPKVVLAKPQSYMNASGGPVSALLNFYSLKPENLVVLHDELDIQPQEIKLKFGGGHGGHNGLRDIIAALNTQEFNRVRIGIGRPPGRMDAADYVLKDFSTAERQELATTLEICADATIKIVTDGLLAAQQQYHAPTDS